MSIIFVCLKTVSSFYLFERIRQVKIDSFLISFVV